MDREPEPNPLRNELARLGWGPEQLIARVNQHRARRGSVPLHRKTGYPWMRGDRPSADAIGDVLAVLSQYTGRQLTPSSLNWDRPRQRRRHRTALDSPYEATAEELLRETQGDTPMHRRSFILLSGAAATAPALDLLMGGAPALAAAQDGDKVSPKLAGTVEHAVRQAREHDDSEGSASTLLWAGGIWQNVGKLIAESRYDTAEGIRLHTAYIEMSETYGWMLFDAGHHPQAQRVYQTGLRVAREAEHAPGIHHATVNLLASAAYQESWLGQYHEATTLLEVAENRRPQALTPRLRAVLEMRRIALAGQQGDTEALHRADGQARTHLAAAHDSGEPWWTLWLDSSAIDAQTGRALLAAHHPDLAEPYLAGRTVLTGDGYPRDRMLFASELADARLQTGDINGACTAARHALTLAQHVGSHRVHHHLDTVTTALRHHHGNHPRVRTLLTDLPHAV
ncbi:XRE family transcriptional regulator [Streptomyces sp. NPDC002785]|uniref:XRE family transcriptional regulator n=1 Tax=Streptomyces sp. NPDC002785 TaxID=3154543 RepID=UPI003329FDEC